MKISGDVLYGFLAERFSLGRYGTRAHERELALPYFYNPELPVQEGATYVARTSDLKSRPTADCLIVALGPAPALSWRLWPCEVIHVEDDRVDLLTLFNVVQRFYGRLIRWILTMQQLANEGASPKSLVESSILLFENRITVTDYNLRIVAHCRLDEQSGRIAMNDDFELVPSSRMSEVSKNARQAMRNREPYFVEEEGRGDNYCINLFVGDTYLGCCSLQEDLHPLRPCDLELFGLFAEFVRQSISAQLPSGGSQLVSMHSVFLRLLDRLPVNENDLENALELVEFNLGNLSLDDLEWRCVVVRAALPDIAFPSQYLRSSLETMLPHAVAISHGTEIAALCLADPKRSQADDICSTLEPLLVDMDCMAGVSRPFHNVLDARDYFEQARCALQVRTGSASQMRCRQFDACALDFMLANSCGELRPSLVIAPELEKLRGISSGGVDYLETLRSYLDNNCNAARTANELFVHRSTLCQRIEHIERYVDLSDPRGRLYLRMCLDLLQW